MSDGVNTEQLLRIYAQSKTIAVVGASADESKAAHKIPATCNIKAIAFCR
jgi:predicted CoA-binding protein